MFKEGILHPLFKKPNAPKSKPTNYRGITIISILGKLLELVMLSRVHHLIKGKQNKLQRGFTEKVSPIFAALILTEMVNKYHDNREDLTVVFLDAEKAFDRVWHAGLFRKLKDLGFPDSIHGLLTDWYRGFRSQVKWMNQLSPPVLLGQGTIQGSSISPHTFKCNVKDALYDVTDRHIGAMIGTHCVAVPTCADDIVAAGPSSLYEDTTVLRILEHRFNLDRTVINGKKTQGLHFKFSGSKRANQPMLYMNGTPIEFVDSATHLGILQGPVAKLGEQRVKERIKGATKALYALFGAGLHGRNGLNPAICRKIWVTYILPRLLYGCELWELDKASIQKLEVFQREKCRQIQNLPSRTAKIAVLGMLGLAPIEAEIDIKALSLFRNVATDQESLEYNIALRQLATKDVTKSSSWFANIERKLLQYSLPSAHTLLKDPPGKRWWNELVRKTVVTYWEDKYRQEAEQKGLTSIRNMAGGTRGFTSVAQVWMASTINLRETAKARVKAKLMSGTIHLQATEALFSGGRISPICKLCGEEEEDRTHFVLRCPAMQSTRSEHLLPILGTLEDHGLGYLTTDQTQLYQVIADCTHEALFILPEKGNASLLDCLERMSRDLIYYLYLRRITKLNLQIPKPITLKPIPKSNIPKQSAPHL
jgi:hypothetical protein